MKIVFFFIVWRKSSESAKVMRSKCQVREREKERERERERERKEKREVGKDYGASTAMTERAVIAVPI